MQIPVRSSEATREYYRSFCFSRDLLTKPPRARMRSQFARMFNVDKRYRERSGSFDVRPITFAPGT